jgi:hypothetical protein
MVRQTLVSVYIPASVLEELIAHHVRAVEESQKKLELLSRERRSLGLGPLRTENQEFDYRSYLTDRFDRVLGFNVMGWPKITHQELVARAVSRTAPFDPKGGGYRDSLVWASVIELAKAGNDIALATEDKIFSGSGNTLAESLGNEAAEVRGDVELIRDLGKWLIVQLPWSSDSLEEAVARGHDDEFYNFFLQSGIAGELAPEAKDLGFLRPFYSLDITGVEWGGMFLPLGGAKTSDGLIIAEYDIDQLVDFEADLPEVSEVEEGWEVSQPDFSGRISVRGQIRMIVRLAVLFADEFGLSVDEVAWRRADGSGPGTSRIEEIPGQLSLFDSGRTDDSST